MKHLRSKTIKNAQKASVLMREVAQYVMRISYDDKRLEGLYVNRVKLSPDGGLCTIMFYTSQGKEVFQEKLPILILYKPSMRSAIAKTLQARYTPEILFAFDEEYDKKRVVDELIDRLKEEGRL